MIKVPRKNPDTAPVRKRNRFRGNRARANGRIFGPRYRHWRFPAKKGR